MVKIKRGGYTFIAWKGDHDPKHVHIFEGRKEVLKWNLEDHVAMKGKVTTKLKKVIEKLVRDKKL